MYYKNLYPKITDFNNLYAAWHKARKGKRYTPGAAAFEQNLDAELIALHQQLVDESWQPGGFRSFTVRDLKRRKISCYSEYPAQKYPRGCDVIHR